MIANIHLVLAALLPLALQDGVDAIKRGDSREGRDLILSIESNQLSPAGKSVSDFYIAKSYHDERDFESFLRAAQEIRRDRPSDPALDDLAMLEALMYERQSRWMDAVRIYRKFSQDFPTSAYVSGLDEKLHNAEAMNAFARAMASKDADRFLALRQFESFVRFYPSHRLWKNAMFEASNLALAMGDYSTGDRLTKALLERYPDHEPTAHLRQQLEKKLIFEKQFQSYFLEKNYGKAVRDFDDWLVRNPGHSDRSAVFFYKAMAIKQLGDESHMVDFLDGLSAQGEDGERAIRSIIASLSGYLVTFSEPRIDRLLQGYPLSSATSGASAPRARSENPRSYLYLEEVSERVASCADLDDAEARAVVVSGVKAYVLAHLERSHMSNQEDHALSQLFHELETALYRTPGVNMTQKPLLSISLEDFAGRMSNYFTIRDSPISGSSLQFALLRAESSASDDFTDLAFLLYSDYCIEKGKIWDQGIEDRVLAALKSSPLALEKAVRLRLLYAAEQRGEDVAVDVQSLLATSDDYTVLAQDAYFLDVSDRRKGSRSVIAQADFICRHLSPTQRIWATCKLNKVKNLIALGALRDARDTLDVYWRMSDYDSFAQSEDARTAAFFELLAISLSDSKNDEATRLQPFQRANFSDAEQKEISERVRKQTRQAEQ
ncbi:hypothetical protein GC173_17750 [bacterium]|nr:hypothetical protein [bacterium]